MYIIKVRKVDLTKKKKHIDFFSTIKAKFVTIF